MNNAVTMEMLHEDIENLKKDISELKQILLMEPKLREEVILKVKEARSRLKTSHVSNEDIKKEFGV